MNSIPLPFIRKEREVDNRIQLELPDYSAEYEEWIRKKREEDQNNNNQTVIIIDIY